MAEPKDATQGPLPFATETPLDRAKRAIQRKASVVHHVLNSPDGKQLMEILQEEFFEGEMYDPNPHRMIYLLGARDVVAYLRQLAKHGENAK